ncbi:hypothetical protein PENTCL1PPCAC_9440, partial [Pristionchus entomophagus]
PPLTNYEIPSGAPGPASCCLQLPNFRQYLAIPTGSERRTARCLSQYGIRAARRATVGPLQHRGLPLARQDHGLDRIRPRDQRSKITVLSPPYMCCFVSPSLNYRVPIASFD